MINFDKLFEKWFKDWMSQNQDKYEDMDEVETMIPELYHKFIHTYCKEIDCAPINYYDNITSPKALIDELIAECEGDNSPNEILLDKIIDTQKCGEELRNLIISQNKDNNLLMLSINLLQEMAQDHPLSTYVDWIIQEDIDDEVKDLVVEILSDNANEVQEQLYNILDKATDSEKGMIADILVCAKKDDRTYNLLIDLFNKGENIPFVAGLLGKYDDDRSASTLYKALDNCNYLEYIEIKNAIERMGGVVDEDLRDFSDDEYYKAIKHLK